MNPYDPTGFAHGLAVLRQLVAERDFLQARHLDEGGFAIRARFVAEIDIVLELLIADLDAVAGRSTAAAELLFHLYGAQDDGPLDLDRIDALHATFALQLGSLHADTLRQRAHKARKAARAPRVRKPAHPFTAKHLRRLMDELGLVAREHGLHERLAAAILDQTGRPITADQLRRLITAANKLPRSR